MYFACAYWILSVLVIYQKILSINRAYHGGMENVINETDTKVITCLESIDGRPTADAVRHL